jgi:formate/nitrite transporter FocA (FNT family)
MGGERQGGDGGSAPQQQFMQAELVPSTLAAESDKRVTMDSSSIIVLAILAGMFVALGGLLSVLLSAGVETEGPRLLLAGAAFSVGYIFVALAQAVLFTEANVTLPDALLNEPRRHKHVARFWSLSFAFNFVGAFVLGWLVYLGQFYSEEINRTLEEIVAEKMKYRERGANSSWLAIVVSGMLAKLLVGLGFFFAFMARTVIGKIIPLALAVILFEAANFQHSPANMGTSAW